MMLPKPKHLGPEYGAIFQDRSVAEAYHHRPPYPAEVFEVLAGLIAGSPRAVLDVGCGTGDIARRLVALVDRLDAVDFSPAMIEKGRRLPGGDHRSLRWVHSSVEDAPLAPPYALITAGECLHWLAWDVVFPRFVDALIPAGVVAIVERDWDVRAEVRDRLRPIFSRFSTNRDYRPYDLVAELERRGLFHRQGERRCRPVPWRPSADEYVECRHSQNGLSRDRMGPSAAAFDAALREALAELIRAGAISIHDGTLDLEVEATITWGKPVWPWG
ncbi:MAG: methyltransferase domain-containing protein [Chloroflexi bacterium]|nr:methyltransferase domain-containing protein [Chloroflexota bacterium]